MTLRVLPVLVGLFPSAHAVYDGRKAYPFATRSRAVEAAERIEAGTMSLRDFMGSPLDSDPEQGLPPRFTIESPAELEDDSRHSSLSGVFDHSTGRFFPYGSTNPDHLHSFLLRFEEEPDIVDSSRVAGRTIAEYVALREASK